ncbi:MAG: hypothetical protein ACI810_000590 [Gammaproteobacteria bacterium]|jgi:hypothetical protein
MSLFILLCVSLAYGHKQVVAIPSPTVYAIGDTGPAGGKVFYITHEGLHGLEAAPVDQASALWNCFGTDVVGVTNITAAEIPDDHSGATNTPLIAVACGGAAAVAAVYVWPNGQTDGFLPNKEELNLLYAQRAEFVGGFAGSLYWSSSEFDDIFAWNQIFGSDNQVLDDKFSTNSVRAVRVF